MNYLLILLAMIALLFARFLTPTIKVTEKITPAHNVIKLHYDSALEGAMINLWIVPLVHDLNQGIIGGNPLLDEYVEEEFETIEIEDNQDFYND